MKLSDFDYHLPQELIAQEPAVKRDHSRLMIVNRQTGKITHDYFYNVLKYLDPTDLLVFNQSKVFPARLLGKKPTGGKVEILLTRGTDAGWEYISKPGLADGQIVDFDEGLQACVQNGLLIFNIDNKDLRRKLDSIGHIPLPHYIESSRNPLDTEETRSRYQTIYAKDEGSVAAPTAGFHFTPELLAAIPNKAFVTLHVGLGTFKPVKTENIEEHHMHSEQYEISPEAISQISAQQTAKQRIIAVGTTSVRTLETWANTGKLSGETNIFMYPGYEFKVIDGLITNFHLPKSTLLMLVSAFADRELVMHAYEEAVAKKYRFYSFGDAMLLV